MKPSGHEDRWGMVSLVGCLPYLEEGLFQVFLHTLLLLDGCHQLVHVRNIGKRGLGQFECTFIKET